MPQIVQPRTTTAGRFSDPLPALGAAFVAGRAELEQALNDGKARGRQGACVSAGLLDGVGGL
jgi:hypothetical protein